MNSFLVLQYVHFFLPFGIVNTTQIGVAWLKLNDTDIKTYIYMEIVTWLLEEKVFPIDVLNYLLKSVAYSVVK